MQTMAINIKINHIVSVTIHLSTIIIIDNAYIHQSIVIIDHYFSLFH